MGAILAPWPLAGRDGELGTFEAMWALRHCQGVIIAGSAGVGKSRLAEECLAQAVRGGFKGRRATASAATAAVPLGAVAHLIPAGVDLSDPVKGFVEVARALAGPGRDRRWAVLVDDMHLLDTTSVMLLRQLMDAGLMRLIGTLRTGNPPSEAVQALSGGDEVGRIDLGAFNREQTERVLQAALGGPVTRRTVHELFSASGGNALYLRELVLGALADGSLAFNGEIWQLADGRVAGTPRLAELIAGRLAGADPKARVVLDLLALCEPVGLADARAEAQGPQVLAGLEESGLLRVTQERARTMMALAHPLYGEMLRARLSVLRRRYLLLAQVERIGRYGARRRGDTLRMAAWRLAATGTADPALLVQAAALARYAHDYPQALALLEALPKDAQTDATRLMLGEVFYELGESERAEQVLADAFERAQGEQEILAATMARTLNLFWSAARTEDALAVNDRARARVTGEAGLRMLRYSEGSMRIGSGEPARGLALLEDLGDDIRDAPDPVAWLTGAMMKPVGLEMTGRTAQAVVFAEHAYSAHLAVDDRTLYPHPAVQLLTLVYVLARNGQLAHAYAVGEHAYSELTASGIPLVRMWMALILAEVELLAGHPVRARRLYAEAAALARLTRIRRTLNAALNGVSICAALQGDLDAARQAAEEARAYPPVGFYLHYEYLASAWLAAACGDLRKARSVLTEGAAKVRAAGMIPAEALLLTDTARLGGAQNVTDRLAELAAACDGTLISACADFAAALAADDPDLLMAVAEELQETSADLLVAEAATAAAAAYGKAGNTHKATAATQQAQAYAALYQGARTPLLTTAKTTAALTTREKEIALLAAAGTASKDMAERLHLSVRTVDNHLQHAYAKLGITTRRELASVLGPGFRS